MTTATPSLWRRYRRTTLGKSFVHSARRLIDTCAERYLRIETTKVESRDASNKGHFGDSIYYAPLDYPLVGLFLKALKLGPDDVAYDIGCGSGRIVCVMARRNIRKCVGVEFAPELAEEARVNLARLRGKRCEAEIITADAAFVDYTEGTAFYLFNPFGPTTMRSVIERIHESVRQRPRRIRILYANPFHESVFAESGWLRKEQDLKWSLFNTSASLWVSKD